MSLWNKKKKKLNPRQKQLKWVGSKTMCNPPPFALRTESLIIFVFITAFGWVRDQFKIPFN